jgi:carbon monoxide dehydrogenase subunit G
MRWASTSDERAGNHAAATMKVQLEKSFPVPASADVAWALLQDIERVAGCMPGAKISERVDEKNYKGTVAVKFGPASMAFRGDVEVRLVEPATKTLRLIGKGTDTTGSSGASMDLTARIDTVDAANCTLVGNSEVSMSGKAATFGGRMMSSVADQVLKQFAASFAGQSQALMAQMQSSVAPPAATPASGDAPPVPMTLPPLAPTAPSQLNGLALAWAVFKDWLRSLFSARRI